MINKRLSLLDSSDAYLDTYFLSDSDQIQIGARRPVVIVCPGGAYLRTSDQEAEQVALHFNILGYHAAVLRYSCGTKARMPGPMLELGTAIRMLRSECQTYLIRPKCVAICGFSAGGHLSAMLSTNYEYVARLLGCNPQDVRPDAAVLGYPCTSWNLPTKSVELDNFTVGQVDSAHPEKSVHPLFKSALIKENGHWMLNFSRSMEEFLFDPALDSASLRELYSPLYHVTSSTTPTFVWATANDDLVPAIHSIEYVRQLYEKGVSCEFHLFAEGHHGLSLADETVADKSEMINPEVAQWFPMAASWMKKLFGQLEASPGMMPEAVQTR